MFQVTLQAITKWQNISIIDPVVSDCFLHFLDFGNGQTEQDIIGHWKKLDRTTAVWLSHSCLRDRICQFSNFTIDLQFYWLKCKTHMANRVPSKHPILCLWRCRPDTAYNPLSLSYLVPAILRYRAPFLSLDICSDRMVPNTEANTVTSENAYGT